VTLYELIKEIHTAGHETELTIRVSEVNRVIYILAASAVRKREVVINDTQLHCIVDPERILERYVLEVLESLRYTKTGRKGDVKS
jgi:hypothetical protein